MQIRIIEGPTDEGGPDSGNWTPVWDHWLPEWDN